MDWTSPLLFGFIGLGVIASMNYVGYLHSRRSIAAAYGELAKLWGGTLRLGSLYRPPKLSFESNGTFAELSTFYLYLGKIGHYTQLRFELKERYLQAFIVHPDRTSDRGYEIDSCHPDLPERLLEQDWASPINDIESLSSSTGTEIRFDGSTLLVRKRALLLKPENLIRFKDASERLLNTLTESLGQPIGGVRPQTTGTLAPKRS